MFKRVIVYYILIVTIAFNLFGLSAFAAAKNEDISDAQEAAKTLDNASVFDLKAKSAILMDAAMGNVLIEKNSHERLPFASVTKVMSMLLIMEAIDSGKITFEDKVVVSDHAYSMGGSQVWLEPGEEFTVDEMLKAVAVGSANDATVALAEKVAGSEDAFVGMMNDKAKALGMNDTHFLDCTGLTDEGHYSSAYDIALMSRELVNKHPKILEYTSIWHSLFRDGVEGKKPVSLDNTNKLIRYYEGTNGLKTGFTSAAGYCLSASVKRGNLQLVSVVLGEPDSNTRFAESRKLLDYGFANFETTQVNTKGEYIQNIEVKKGLAASVRAVYAEDVNLLLKKGKKGKIERTVNIETMLEAPVSPGQKVGEVIFKVDGKEVGKAEVVAESSVERASFMRLFFRMVLQWFGIGRNS